MSAQQTLTVDGSKGYDWVDGDGLVQGTDYIIPGTDGTWYAMPDFFTHKEGNVWTFNAYSTPDYAYWITLDQNLKSVNVTYRVDGKRCGPASDCQQGVPHPVRRRRTTEP